MVGKKILKIEDDEGSLIRLTIKDEKAGISYPCDVTREGLKVILLENQILETGLSAKLLEEYKEAVIVEEQSERMYDSD